MEIIKSLENRIILLKGNTGKVISQEGELKKKVPKRSWFIINEISTHTIS